MNTALSFEELVQIPADKLSEVPIEDLVKGALDPRAKGGHISKLLTAIRPHPRALHTIVHEGIKHVYAEANKRQAAEGLPRLEIPKELAPAGEIIAEDATQHSRLTEPAYHNRPHFVDSTLQAFRLAASEPAHLSPEHREKEVRSRVLVGMDMPEHDLGHAGGTNPPGKPAYLEEMAVGLSKPILDQTPLTAWDKEFMAHCTIQTAHVLYHKSARERYEAFSANPSQFSVDEGLKIVGGSLARTADTSASTALSFLDTIRQGTSLQKELLDVQHLPHGAHLKDQGWIANLHGIKSQITFIRDNGTYIESPEGERMRQQQDENIRLLGDIQNLHESAQAKKMAILKETSSQMKLSQSTDKNPTPSPLRNQTIGN